MTLMQVSTAIGNGPAFLRFLVCVPKRPKGIAGFSSKPLCGTPLNTKQWMPRPKSGSSRIRMAQAGTSCH